MSSREEFETAYSELMGTPASVLKNLRDGDEYRETEGHRMQVAWLMWQAASKASEQQLAAVVAENAGLKQAINTHSQSTHFCEVCGKDDPCSTDDVCYVLNETPATDANLAEVRAQGVDMFGQYHNFSEKLFIQKEAKKFASQLRKGAAL